MASRLPLALLVCGVVLGTVGVARGQTGSVTRNGRCGATPAKNLYRFCYDGTSWLVDEPLNQRFTDRDRVEVDVQHVNYLRYTLSFDVQEQKSEAYQYLTKLFTSGLGASLGSLAGALGGQSTAEKAAGDQFITNSRELLRTIDALDSKVSATLVAHRKPGLNPAEVAALRLSLGSETSVCPIPAWTDGPDPLISCPVEALRVIASQKYAALEQGVHSDNTQFKLAHGELGELYGSLRAAYGAATERADQFAALALKSLGTETRKVGKRAAGTKVTLLLAAVDAGGSRSPIGDVSYFVETTIPLTAHGGLVFSRLRDVTFAQVKRANGGGEDDLFLQETNAATSKGFSLFLGWRLCSLDVAAPSHASRAALLISLGTDIASPGEKVYVGPTVMLFGRVGITGGIALGKEQEGQQQTLEPNVFRLIAARPKTSWFLSFTTRIY